VLEEGGEVPIAWNEVSAGSQGGTERMGRELERRLPGALLERFQIIPSRVRELDRERIRILWLHNTAVDPEAQAALGDNGWRRFHRLVFVSNHQMQSFIEAFGIPWERCRVLANAIAPIPRHQKPGLPIRLIYTSTPQRGLEILYAVFCRLAQTHAEIELDVFSSFKLYGWDDADAPFAPLFEKLAQHPRIRWHGARPHDEVRAALQRAHVLAYPSIWQETSGIVLMEAMAAGLLCVHPNFGALYETAAGLTRMYQWSADKSVHAGVFARALDAAIVLLKTDRERVEQETGRQADYANEIYGWDRRAREWEGFLRELIEHYAQ
jgi:glycosyltransferase involved in cell wall biosynthesis